ncbi:MULTISPECIES: hypothetical protein [Pseudomonas]|uniref:Uncharacterized protein n=1 Tax=Pseudomonas helleri TaxID=1608996 RepID=A0A7X1XEF4_9PSED|nr:MULTISPECIES: hypothetical protein [Pseudomonas]MQT51945.1 hypothetical protein [Pseudomonas sp. FSL R10-2398]MQT90042.1 hypothetical protein [Pseudomonas helleri]
MNEFGIDPLWCLHDEFTVEQAAALIAGYDPGYVARCSNDTNFQSDFSRLYPARTALINAINAKRLKAALRSSAREYGYADRIADIDYGEAEYLQAFGTTAEEDETLSRDHSCFYKPFPDWTLSTVSRDDLMAWLETRNYPKTGFFFPTVTDAPDYLDRKHPRYSAKLAAAVKVWQAMDDDNLLSGKAVKDAIREWLESRYKELELIWNGKINKTGIDESVKVANWKTDGGATKTPG